MLARSRLSRFALAASLVAGSLCSAAGGFRTSRAQDGPPRGLENRGRGVLPAHSDSPDNAGSSDDRSTHERARTDGGPLAPTREKVETPPKDEVLAALDRPLSRDERAVLDGLVCDLGARDLAAREHAAREIRTRFGARAAAPLLDLCRRERDPERRFRERALVASLVHVAYAAKAHDCGWLGVRWQMSRTDTKSFSVHVVEPLRNEPAALGGLRVDDEILLWNGTALETQEEFIDRVQTAAPGSTVALSVDRPILGPDQKVAGWQHLVIKIVMGRREERPDSYDLAWFHRDLATRELELWLEAWQKTRRD